MILDWQDTIDAFLDGRAGGDTVERLSRRLDLPPDGRTAAADVLALDAGLARVMRTLAPPQGAVERLLGALAREGPPADQGHGREESGDPADGRDDEEVALVAETDRVASAIERCLADLPIPQAGPQRMIEAIRAEDEQADVSAAFLSDGHEGDAEHVGGDTTRPMFPSFGQFMPPADVRAASKEEPGEDEQESTDKQ